MAGSAGATGATCSPRCGSSASISPAIRTFSIHAWDHMQDERRAGMRALIDMLAKGQLHPRIFARLKLAEAQRAHELLESGVVLGKLLLQP